MRLFVEEKWSYIWRMFLPDSGFKKLSIFTGQAVSVHICVSEWASVCVEVCGCLWRLVFKRTGDWARQGQVVTKIPSYKNIAAGVPETVGARRRRQILISTMSRWGGDQQSEEMQCICIRKPRITFCPYSDVYSLRMCAYPGHCHIIIITLTITIHQSSTKHPSSIVV